MNEVVLIVHIYKDIELCHSILFLVQSNHY